MDRILIVRLGSLGDIVHTLPAAAALRDAFPRARIDWLVDVRTRAILDLVPVIDRRIVLDSEKPSAWRKFWNISRELQRNRYDAAVDLQGLLKSAALARASGARRVIGFARSQLRERTAAPFYSEMHDTSSAIHVIEKNLALVAALGAATGVFRFPIEPVPSVVPAAIRGQLAIGASGRFALLNPGAGWPNKRWPPERFGAVAKLLRDRHDLPSAVLWGPGEQSMARIVADASEGAAQPAPETTVIDLLALAREAALMVSGDTGPLHLAAAVGTPIVGIYGPTNPARNGPWSADDITVNRFHECACPHRRRCRVTAWCLAEIGVHEVMDAIEHRLAAVAADA